MTQTCCQYPHGPRSADDGVFPAHDRIDDGTRYEIRRVEPVDYLEIYVDGIPAASNETRRRHWSAVAGEAARWRGTAKIAGLEARERAPFATPLLYASIEYVFRLDASRGDLDNLAYSAKPVLDGLRDAGLFVDDSVSKLPLLVVRWERALRRGIVIRIRPYAVDQIGLFE